MPVIARSARQHGIADEDMLNAFYNSIQGASYDDGLTLQIGRHRAGNLLEVGTVDAEDTIVIVRAMHARPSEIR